MFPSGTFSSYWSAPEIAANLLIFINLLGALALGLLVGYERAYHGRAAGMRTHIIVCIGAAMTALVGLYTTDVLGQSSDPMRLSAQVISGIGFLGGGMILIRGRHRISRTEITVTARRALTFTPHLFQHIGWFFIFLQKFCRHNADNTVVPPRRTHDQHRVIGILLSLNNCFL